VRPNSTTGTTEYNSCKSTMENIEERKSIYILKPIWSIEDIPEEASSTSVDSYLLVTYDSSSSDPQTTAIQW